jgi:preprotein translocase subunit SecG
MIGLQSQTLVFKKAVWIFAFIFILCTMTVAGIIPKSSDKVIEININSLQMRFF